MRGYAGRVQALKAAAQRKHDQDEQQRRSEVAVDAHQGENSASGAVVEEFQFSRRYAVDLDLLTKSLQWTNTHCKWPLLLKMRTKSVKFGLANYQALHLLSTCMRTGKPMPYIIKAKWYVRTVCSHHHSSGGNGSCMMAPTDVNLI